MKNVYPLLLIFLLGLSAITTVAQPVCGFDAAHQKLMQSDPQYKLNVQTGNNFIRTYIQSHPELLRRNDHKTITSGNPGQPQTLSGPYLIPVVVHVIHTGGDVGTIYNPGDAQILGAIDYLNKVYAGTWPGTLAAPYGAGDLGIQFVLAQRDPSCNPTNGINRIDGSGVAGYVSGGVNQATALGTDELNIKGLSRWDNTKYYNIWIVDKIDGNNGTTGQYIAGYAYFPGASSAKDGIVMLATQMIAGQKTLPHEIGHAFNLFHPFNLQSYELPGPCSLNANCNADGDAVCDTDPIAENISGGVIDFHCRTGQANPCKGNAPFTQATEENYMNYTNCYTLFTPGQMARMQAAALSSRASLTTSLGGTPPDVSCTPKIDFQLQGDRQTETTTTSSACRNYTDYTYNMIIGTAPSATATATLTVAGGTATQGLDFDVTTNGSFSSPSQQLTFAAGATTSQPFTVRIYDDASVNGTRTAILGFTLNTGGGTAVIGDGRPNFTFTIDDNDIAPTSGASPTNTVGIGTNQGTTTLYPFDATQASQRTQFQYRASELTAAGIPAGKISGLNLYVSNKQTTRPFTNLNIKLGTSPYNYLVDNVAGTITVGTSMTVVKTLNSYTTKAGFNTFTFDVPYTWDGTSNIVVEICYDEGSASSTGGSDFLGLQNDGNSTLGQGNMIWQTGVNCWENLTSLIYSTIKPYIQFTYGVPPTTVQTAVNSSQSQQLGPNADIYFYDQTNGQLMARIQNLTSFDYGCTQVVLDRAGTSATQFWNTNTTNYLMDKTFHVIPTTNNSSGSYNITLFYTQAEIQGWQTATGQTLSAIQLIKVPGQIFSVTPSNPTAAGTALIVTPTITALGTNTGLSFHYTNGFSGFGAGVPSFTSLPITLIDFTGILENNNAVLSWSTAQEQNSAGFEVTRSFDGQHFAKIGYVPAAGNSSIEKDYTFTDPSLSSDSNFYQLKELSLDGNTSYSKVILVRDPRHNPGFTVLPNPFTTELDIIFGYVPSGKADIRLLDITGRTLWRQAGIQATGARLHINLAGATLAPGVYFLEVNSEVQRILKR